MNDSNNNNSSNEQVMNIKGMKVRIDDPLYKVGVAEDGTDYSAEYYVVQVETPCGRRFSHNHGFYTSELCYTEDGHEAFTDEREEKRAQAERQVILFAPLVVLTRITGLRFNQFTAAKPMLGKAATPLYLEPVRLKQPKPKTQKGEKKKNVNL